MLKKLVALLLALTMTLSLITGCTKGSDLGENQGDAGDASNSASGTLMWNIGSDPKSFDPQLNGDGPGSNIVCNLFEGLMKDTKDGDLVPAQAESYEISDDGLKYTFILRDDIKWSDGEPVTAKDFEYSWKRACDPKVGSPYSYMVTSYLKNGEAFFKGEVTADEVGVKATDDKTLEVQLETPVPFFLSLMSFFTFMPVRQDIVEANGEGWEKKPATCISNGPFALKEYQVGSHILMEKNEHYYNKDSVKLKQVKGLMISDGNTALNAYQAGDIQVNDVIPPAEKPRLIAEDPNLVNTPRIGVDYINFNVDVEPTNDVRVRKAMALAIDRKALCELVLKSGQIPATGVVPPVFNLSDGSNFRKLDANGRPMEEYGVDPNAAKVEEAKKLLAEAGYPDGKGFPKLTYTYSTSDDRRKVAEAMQEMWKSNLGIDVELQNMEWAIVVDKNKRGDFVIASGGWSGDYVDPMTMFDAFRSNSSWNEAQWRWQETPVAPHDKTLNPANKFFDEAVKNAMYTTGAERDKQLKEAERVLMEDMPISPLFYRNYSYLVDQAKVQNVWRNKIGDWIFRDVEVFD